MPSSELSRIRNLCAFVLPKANRLESLLLGMLKACGYIVKNFTKSVLNIPRLCTYSTAWGILHVFSTWFEHIFSTPSAQHLSISAQPHLGGFKVLYITFPTVSTGPMNTNNLYKGII